MTVFPSRPAIFGVVLAAVFLLSHPARAQQLESPAPAQPLPDAPRARAHAAAAETSACQLRRAGNLLMEGAAGAGGSPPEIQRQQPAPCPPFEPFTNWFDRFLNGPQVKPLTPAEKARLAMRNVLDPFNAVTILGTSAISVGSDAHSPYGPGMNGFGKYVGVSYTQDLTGEFFGTFLIPSLTHQDPHYHRMPNASIPRRIRHAITQVVWTQGDNGRGMVNYANLVGFAIDDEISNLYVPGRETDFSASASRYGIGLASAPIDNFITEFLPDVARRIHVRVVLIQRIINQVAKTGGPAGQ